MRWIGNAQLRHTAGSESQKELAEGQSRVLRLRCAPAQDDRQVACEEREHDKRDSSPASNKVKLTGF